MSTPERPMILLACVTADQPSVFTDNTQARCAVCGAAIYHRPYALRDLPRGARPACLPCAARYAEHHRTRGADMTVGITRRAMDEVARHVGRH